MGFKFAKTSFRVYLNITLNKGKFIEILPLAKYLLNFYFKKMQRNKIKDLRHTFKIFCVTLKYFIMDYISSDII